MKSLINALGALFGHTWSFLGTTFEWILEQNVRIFTKLFNIPPWALTLVANVTAIVSIVITTTTDVATQVAGVVSDLISKVGTMQAGSFSSATGTASGILATINTFIPLEEAMAFLAVFLALTLTCAIIRMLKSCIPGLS